MGKRTKYEPAGGVVELDWQKDQPSPEEAYGTIIVEFWWGELGHWDISAMHVHAVLKAVQWNLNQCRWEISDGSDIPKTWRWRRWARLSGTFRSLSLTLKDWA